MKNIIVTGYLLLAAVAGTSAQDTALAKVQQVAKGAVLNKVSSQFSFTEGPAVNKKGDVYFTDQPNDKIWKYDAKGKLSLFMDKTGRSNGLYFDQQGNIIACADEKESFGPFHPPEKTVLLDNYEGKQLNGPNDLWIDPKGGIYFTDPYYQRNYWERKQSAMDGMKVYYLPKGAKQARIVDDKIVKPNGIVGTPDGKTLYVADIQAGKTYRYTIADDGSLGNKELFVSQGSDGITLDNKGNIYLSGNGVTVYNSQGVKVGHIPVPSKWVGTFGFGGKKKNILFITASESIYTLKMNVKGVE